MTEDEEFEALEQRLNMKPAQERVGLEQAARQALEALETGMRDSADFGRISYGEFLSAITALRQALEQPAIKQSLTTEQPEEIPEPPHCMVGGFIKDNAMCGHVIQMKFCGYGGPCQYKRESK